MGAICVCLWIPPASTHATTVLSTLNDRLTRIEQATVQNRFSLQLRLFRWQNPGKNAASVSNTGKPKTLMTLRRANPPVNETFVYIEDPAAPLRTPKSEEKRPPNYRTTVSLVQANSFDILTSRTLLVPPAPTSSNQNTGQPVIAGWTSRSAAAIEGISLQLGDFSFRAGLYAPKTGVQPIYILIEIEYLPVNHLPNLSLFKEFLSSIIPSASSDIKHFNFDQDFQEANLPLPSAAQEWTEVHRDLAYVSCLRQQGAL